MMNSPRSENKSMFLQCFMSRRDVVIGMHSSNESTIFTCQTVIMSWRCIHEHLSLFRCNPTFATYLHTHNMTSTGNLSPSLRRGSSNMSSRRPSHGADGPSGVMSTADANMPMRHPRPLTAAELHLELEKEQEAVVCSFPVLHIYLDNLTLPHRSTVSHANSQHSAPNTLPLSPAILHKPAPTKLWSPVSHTRHPHVNTAHLRTPQAVVLALLRPRVTSTFITPSPPLLLPASRRHPSIVLPPQQAPLPQTLRSVATPRFAAPQATPHQPSRQPFLTALRYRKPLAKSPQPARSLSVQPPRTHPHPVPPKSLHHAPNSTS